jgi:magnesium-transporting ATPase (P-type)
MPYSSIFDNLQTVNVYRGEDHFEEVPSSSLVPGDVIVVPTGNQLMACDAVLVSGLTPLS